MNEPDAGARWPLAVAERTSRSHGRRTLAKLLDVAVAELDTHGYHDTRMARIAKAAGVAHGTVYAYFKDKDDLLAALQRDVDAELRPSLLAMPAIEPRRPIEEAAPGAARLEEWARSVCDVFQRHSPVLQALADALSADTLTLAGREALRSMRATTRHLARRLEEVAGELPGYDCDVAAVCVFALIEAGNRALYLGQLPGSRDDLAREIGRAVQRIAYGTRRSTEGAGRVPRLREA